MAAAASTTANVAAAASVAAAIGVFGVVYGATAAPVLGADLAIASSVLAFSGAAQFSMVGLLATGATTAAVIAATVPLALRHIPLAAVVRPHLPSRRRPRALLSLVLIDETVGLALASKTRAATTMVLAGGLAYAAWVAGTAAGASGLIAGGGGAVADALFPVLFVGLASVTARSASGDRHRAVTAGAASLVLLVVWPAGGVLSALVVAMVVAAVGAGR